MDMLEYFTLTPAFRRWNEVAVPKDDWQGYRAFTSRADQMLGFVSIVWPDFVERDGLILNREHLPEDWQAYL